MFSNKHMEHTLSTLAVVTAALTLRIRLWYRRRSIFLQKVWAFKASKSLHWIEILKDHNMDEMMRTFMATKVRGKYFICPSLSQLSKHCAFRFENKGATSAFGVLTVKLSIIVHVHDPIIWETEAWGLQIWGYPCTISFRITWPTLWDLLYSN